jgi:hypothetical protein
MESKETRKPSEMNVEDLPDVRAFQDEFTRNFLQSTEEIRPDYYPFLSGTGKYKMDFPAGGIIGEKSYARKEKDYEEYSVHIQSDIVGEAMITMFYFSYDTTDELESNLDSFSTRIGKNINFKKIDGENQSFYYGNFERNEFHTYASYIQNEKADGALEVVYQIDCRQEQKAKCNKNKEKNEKHVIDWMKSIRFINESKEVNG